MFIRAPRSPPDNAPKVAKDDPAGGVRVKLSAWDRLDLNVSTTLVELAMTAANMWGREGQRVLQKARGSYAPYRIRNRTGHPIVIWADVDGNSGIKDPKARTTLARDESIDWRFDDWKTTREVFCPSCPFASY
jgi:vacuolar protein sorting-associated protein 13A/C